MISVLLQALQRLLQLFIAVAHIGRSGLYQLARLSRQTGCDLLQLRHVGEVVLRHVGKQRLRRDLVMVVVLVMIVFVHDSSVLSVVFPA